MECIWRELFNILEIISCLFIHFQSAFINSCTKKYRVGVSLIRSQSDSWMYRETLIQSWLAETERIAVTICQLFVHVLYRCQCYRTILLISFCSGHYDILLFTDKMTPIPRTQHTKKNHYRGGGMSTWRYSPPVDELNNNRLNRILPQDLINAIGKRLVWSWAETGIYAMKAFCSNCAIVLFVSFLYCASCMHGHGYGVEEKTLNFG